MLSTAYVSATEYEIRFIRSLWRRGKMDSLKGLREAYKLRHMWGDIRRGPVMFELTRILGKECCTCACDNGDNGVRP